VNPIKNVLFFIVLILLSCSISQRDKYFEGYHKSFQIDNDSTVVVVNDCNQNEYTLKILNLQPGRIFTTIESSRHPNVMKSDVPDTKFIKSVIDCLVEQSNNGDQQATAKLNNIFDEIYQLRDSYSNLDWHYLVDFCMSTLFQVESDSIVESIRLFASINYCVSELAGLSNCDIDTHIGNVFLNQIVRRFKLNNPEIDQKINSIKNNAYLDSLKKDNYTFIPYCELEKIYWNAINEYLIKEYFVFEN